MRYRLILILVTLLGHAGLFAADYDAATSANQLGLDLYRQLSRENPNSNLVLSPYSISSALALVYTGSAGTTRMEMARALHFPTDDRTLQTSHKRLRTKLGQLGDKSIEWHLANRLYGARDYAFHEAFLTQMKDGYGAQLDTLDFRHDAAAARRKVNRWVETQTNDRIHDLIPEGGIDAQTSLVLVNALYLRAPWETVFGAVTKPTIFHISMTETKPVPTMGTGHPMGYSHDRGLTTVALPYIGGELQFVIFLPDTETSLEEVAARLTPAYLASAARLKSVPVELYFPKLRLAAPTISLADTLRSLGMKSAFDLPRGSADFTRIAAPLPEGHMALSDVFHQTFLAVDENGTEATAATGLDTVVLSAAPPGPKPIEVRVDHPFLFAIQHRRTGLCLFLGRITDPS